MNNHACKYVNLKYLEVCILHQINSLKTNVGLLPNKSTTLNKEIVIQNYPYFSKFFLRKSKINDCIKRFQ